MHCTAAAEGPKDGRRGALPRRQSPFSVRWRVDQDESGTHYARLRGTVVELLTTAGADKLRRLVVRDPLRIPYPPSPAMLMRLSSTCSLHVGPGAYLG